MRISIGLGCFSMPTQGCPAHSLVRCIYHTIDVVKIKLAGNGLLLSLTPDLPFYESLQPLALHAGRRGISKLIDMDL